MNIHQQISDVVRNHYHYHAWNGPQCWCGVKGEISEHPDHLADVLAKELGLEVQTRYIDDEQTISTVPTKKRNSKPYERRVVSSWKRVKSE